MVTRTGVYTNPEWNITHSWWRLFHNVAAQWGGSLRIAFQALSVLALTGVAVGQASRWCESDSGSQSRTRCPC